MSETIDCAVHIYRNAVVLQTVWNQDSESDRAKAAPIQAALKEKFGLPVITGWKFFSLQRRGIEIEAFGGVECGIFRLPTCDWHMIREGQIQPV